MSTTTKARAKLTKAMENGKTPHHVELNLYDRAILISLLATPTMSLKEGLRRQKLSRKLTPTQEERKSYHITEPRAGQIQWPQILNPNIQAAPVSTYDLTDEQSELVRDVFALLAGSDQLRITPDVLDIMARFYSESEIEALVPEEEKVSTNGKAA